MLHMTARSTTLAKLTYALPAWWGYASGGERDRLESFIRRAKRAGFLSHDAPTVAEMASKADDRLFNAIRTNDHHVLRRLCPRLRETTYTFRPRPHQFSLPPKDTKNFIPRLLYKDIY